MRIFFLHPDDEPFAGPWADQLWDRVIDLGFAGEESYRRWSAHFGCPVETLPGLDSTDLRSARESLLSPLGRLVDRHGLDWWELIGIRFHEQLEHVLAFKKVLYGFGTNDQLFFSRYSFQSRIAEIFHAGRVRCYSGGNALLEKLRRVSAASLKLGVAQSLQVVTDKYDATYRFRRIVAPRARLSKTSVTLLPSAYVNASRTALAYATALPEHNFLLITTRRSGRLPQYSRNVRVEHLGSYAPGKANPDELQFLQSAWHAARKEIMREPGIGLLSETGLLDCVPDFLHEGLAVRDAWLRVFALEPVNSVLCTDDSNPYTRIPLLIASRRNLSAIACHHGALDGRHLIKKWHREVTILAKGEMERDYLVSRCQIPHELVEVGAPRSRQRNLTGVNKDSILFFSEPYELSGGRCLEFYREVLPKLAELATTTNRKLIIKLHPQESRRSRDGMVRAALSSDQFRHVHILDGVLRGELLDNAWLAVTIMSTTAVECALREIPVFLCGWLDHLNYGYLEQFAKFDVGIRLSTPSDLDQIPEMVERFKTADIRRLWEPIPRDCLHQLLTRPRISPLAAAV